MRKTVYFIFSGLKQLFTNSKLKCFVFSVVLNHFWPVFSFYTPWEHQKISLSILPEKNQNIRGFLLFSRGIETKVFWCCIGIFWVKVIACDFSIFRSAILVKLLVNISKLYFYLWNSDSALPIVCGITWQKCWSIWHQ